MAVESEKSADRTAVQKLTKQEIDRRIQRLTSRLAELREDTPQSDPLHPRFIAPAELVRRLQPFVTYN